MARRTKLTKEIQDKIIQAVKTGATYDICAQYAGIAPSTFYLWMKQGRERKSKDKIEFLEEIKRAESMGAIANLTLIQRAAQGGDWKASAWIMERRHGYSKQNNFNRAEDEESQELLKISNDTKEILKSQLEQSVKASQEALNRGSYQAFAALQRQTVNIAMQLKILDAESIGEGFDDQTDEDIIDQISNIILSLPPVLRQRLQSDIISYMNVSKTATITDN
jgi:transposase-like protein